jgi:GNAT superfamily N-acetyltransferase
VDVDEVLVRRLEATAATAGLDLIDALRRLDPATTAAGREFLGGALIAMGAGRYVNRAIGVTLNEISSADADLIDHFFVERKLNPMVELSSWAPPSTLAEFARRDFVARWFRSVFALALAASAPVAPSTDLRIERVGDDDQERWLDVFNRGFEAEHGETRVANDEIGRASFILPNSQTFLACLDGEHVGCGSIQIVDGIAWLGGAATLPAFRKRGVQASLVAHRLQLAADSGCELAAVTALSNGPSARNIVRLGFQHTHTQVVVERKATFDAMPTSE